MTKAAELADAIKKRDNLLANRILDENPELLEQGSESGISFVMLALYSGDRNIIRSLQNRGGVYSVPDAIAADDIELLASKLSDNPGSVSEYTSDGWTPLHLAAHFGNEAAVQLLLSHKADVNAWSKNDLKNQPLHAGCAGIADEAIIKALLDAGAEIDSRAQGGYTALQLAAGGGNAAIAKLLLSRGADKSVRAENGKTAREMAADGGHVEIAAML